MQVPERLALIGGSILLASTLVFTLKSQASSVIPKVGHSISGVFDHIGDAQKDSDFNSGYQQAQKNGETTGNWGSSKYYISKDNIVHVGQGTPQDMLKTLQGDNYTNIKGISFDQSISLPTDAINLFGGLPNLTTVQGTDQVNTSQTTNMDNLFTDDNNLQNLDLSTWDTSNVTEMNNIFSNNTSLSNLNVSNWNVSKVQNMWGAFDRTGLTQLDLSRWNPSQVQNLDWVFNDSSSLHEIKMNDWDTSHIQRMKYTFNNTSLDLLDLSNFDTSNVSDMVGMVSWNNLKHIKLGNHTYIQSNAGLDGDGNWINQDNQQSLNSVGLQNGGYHQGDWILHK